MALLPPRPRTCISKARRCVHAARGLVDVRLLPLVPAVAVVQCTQVGSPQVAPTATVLVRPQQRRPPRDRPIAKRGGTLSNLES